MAVYVIGVTYTPKTRQYELIIPMVRALRIRAFSNVRTDYSYDLVIG